MSEAYIHFFNILPESIMTDQQYHGRQNTIEFEVVFYPRSKYDNGSTPLYILRSMENCYFCGQSVGLADRVPFYENYLCPTCDRSDR